jgi:signal transduction histidine kinase
MSSKTRQTTKSLQHYGKISLISVTLAAIIIFSFFRYQAINTIQSANAVSYSALAYAIADSLDHHFIEYFKKNNDASRQQKLFAAIDDEAMHTIQHLLADTPITRVKIYDHKGIVVFSTKQSQIGDVQYKNPGFVSAINGKVATKLIYHDTLNIFDQEVEDANLLQCYIPIRSDELSPPIGVFEIYADINELVVNTRNIELMVLFFIVLVMSGLYFVLMFYVRQAEKVINEQQTKSIEKQKKLELLSAKMINAQEEEKKRISDELHEDVVQTISAVKMYFEQCIYAAANNHANQKLTLPYHVIPILQDAIKKIRSVSLDLRPPSLDKFGLKAATNTLISEFNSILSGMNIRVEIDLREEVLTDDKKSIIYRILKDTLRMISLHKQLQGEILIRLRFNEGSGNLQLIVEIVNDIQVQKYYDLNDFELMKENTILSGGEFTVSNDMPGAIMAVSEWENILKK